MEGQNERLDDATTERTRCRSEFAHWRCELPAGHEGLHEHGHGPEATRWSSDLTGRRMSDLWHRER